MLNSMPFSADAAARMSSRDTSSGSTARHDGASHASPADEGEGQREQAATAT